MAACLASACRPFATTPIREILEDPRGFDGKNVKISGAVTESANLIVVRYYRVDDGTGTMTVVANGAVPLRGAKVTASGRVRQAFAIGDQSLTVLLEEP